MSGTGVNYQDLLPIPEKTNAVNNPGEHEKSHAMGEEPSASHALAQESEHQYEKGLAQQDHDLEVKNLGWNEPKEIVPSPLVGGMDNEELWLLVRRFNKQMYHVKETTYPVPGNLDCNIADEDEFSPDKLRATIERLYMTVIIGLMGFGKHIVRIRSWREKRRTTCFALAYLIAWIFDLIMPLFTLFIIVLIAYPPARDICFPPAPLALVDGSTGGVQKPKAGVLGSHDSATGAPENHKGEAVEAEATNFVNGMAHVALSSASGKHPQNEPPSEEGTPQDSVPDPTHMALGAANARVAAGGGKADDPANEQELAKHDKTKVPMENAMWNKMRPIMHGIADVADGWERFANMLSPTPPFPQEAPRLRLAAVVVPLFAISLLTTSYLFTKGAMFGVGAGFFGDPVLIPAIKYLNTHYPNWQKLLELRNTLLKGIPTNAQLTITLLRVGEANKAPLPPPPYAHGPPPDEAAHMDERHLNSAGADQALGASHDEIRDAMAHDPNTAHETAGADIAASKDKKHGKKGSRILGFFKASAKGAVETAIGADRLKATAGSTHAKNRLGVATRDLKSQVSGPVDFRVRYNGKKGHVYISTKATIPCVSFTTDHSVEKIGSQDRTDLHPVWSIAVADIRELKKVGGFGWKAKLVVGWALDRDVADGMEITDREGSVWKITACPLRDELFNRLVAMGGQKWVSW